MTSSRRCSHRRIPLAARWILLLLSVSTIHCHAEVPNGYEHALEVTRRLSRVDASQCGANIGEMIACFFLQCSDEPCTRQTTDVTTPTDGQETCQSLESEVCNLIDAECCPPCNEAAGAYLSCILATDEECPDSSCDAYTIVNDESGAWEKSNSTNTTSSNDNDEMMLDDPPFGAGPPDNITDNGPPDNTPNGPPDNVPNGPPDNTPNGPPDDTPNGPPDDTPNGPPGTSTAKSGATTTNSIHKAESDNSMAASELDVLGVWTSGATSISSSTIVGVVVVIINVLLI